MRLIGVIYLQAEWPVPLYQFKLKDIAGLYQLVYMTAPTPWALHNPYEFQLPAEDYDQCTQGPADRMGHRNPPSGARPQH